MYIESACGKVLEASPSELTLEDFKEVHEGQLWKWNEDGTLQNAKCGVSWEFGARRLIRENHFIVDEETGKVLDIEGGGTTSGTKVILWNKHGGANQRWYFKHIDRHFFIASQRENKDNLVLDVAGATKGGKLIGYKAKGSDNQLWKMDRMGRLICKSDLVADISGENKEPGAKVIGWSSHGGMNQLWTFEDGQLRSNLNNLAMKLNSKNEVEMSPTSTDGAQMWTCVPKDLLEDFKFMEENKNPLLEASFYRTVYNNYFWAVCGFTSIHALKRDAENALKVMREAGTQLDDVAFDTGIAGTVGGAAGITGSVLSLVGLVLAPFSGGASLGLTVAGAAVGVAGGATSLTGDLINASWEKSEAAKYREEFTEVRGGLLRLQGFLNTYIEKLKAADRFLKTDEGETLARDAFDVADAYTAAEIAANVGKVGWNLYKFGNVIVKTVDIAKTIKAAKDTVTFLQADYYVLKGLKEGAALHHASPGLKLPFVSKALVKAGTTTASALTVVFNVVGIAFGIWEVVDSADAIKNGSDLADEFRKTADEIQDTVDSLMALDQEMQS